MPVTLDATATTTAGVALVRLRVHNTEPVPRHVRLANRLDGRLLPPRRDGRPEPGWSEDGYAGVVAADAERALGYACDLVDGADPTATPTDLVAVDDPADAPRDPIDDARADLPDARPPADAVAPVGPEAADAEASSGPPRAADAAGADTADTGAEDVTEDATEDGPDETDGEVAAGDAPPAPPGVRRSLDAAARRISLAETLAEGSVADVTDALENGCGCDPAGLDALVAADAETLSRVADRAAVLAERAERVSVPVGALERLA